MHAAPIFMTDYDFGSDLCRTRDPAQINHMQFSHNSWCSMDQPMGWGAPTLSGKPPALCIGSLGDWQGVKASYREILWQVKSLGPIFWVSKKTRFS